MSAAITRWLFVVASLLALARPLFPADLSLTWKDNASNEDGFLVERSTGPDATAAWVRVATLPKDSQAWTDRGLLPGSLVSYRVAAYNSAGVSAFAGPVSASIPTLPPAPTDAKATIISVVVTITPPTP